MANLKVSVKYKDDNDIIILAALTSLVGKNIIMSVSDSDHKRSFSIAEQGGLSDKSWSAEIISNIMTELVKLSKVIEDENRFRSDILNVNPPEHGISGIIIEED